MSCRSAGRKDIYDNPSCRFVADFIGEANLIPGASLGRDPALTITVRPERIAICASRERRPRRGTISTVTFLGLDTLYEVTADGERAFACAAATASDGFRAGEAVALDWPATAERELLELRAAGDGKRTARSC